MGQTGVHTLRQHFNNTRSVPPWIPSLTSLFIISVLFVEKISYIVGAAFHSGFDGGKLVGGLLDSKRWALNLGFLFRAKRASSCDCFI